MGDNGELAPRAREQSMEEIKQRRQDMHDLDTAIKDTMTEGYRVSWKLAALLSTFEEEAGWTTLGYAKLNDWLADPDVGMSRATFQRMIESYRLLRLHHVEPKVMAELELSKVDIVMPAVRQGRANIDDALDHVKTLGARDLREEYRDPSADKPEPEPEDDPPNLPNVGQNGDLGLAPQNPTDDTPVLASAVGAPDPEPVGGEPEAPVDPDRLLTLLEVMLVVADELRDHPDLVQRLERALMEVPVPS